MILDQLRNDKIVFHNDRDTVEVFLLGDRNDGVSLEYMNHGRIEIQRYVNGLYSICIVFHGGINTNYMHKIYRFNGSSYGLDVHYTNRGESYSNKVILKYKGMVRRITK